MRWIDGITRFVGTANWYQRHKIKEFGGQEMLRPIGDRGRKMLDNSKLHKTMLAERITFVVVA